MAGGVASFGRPVESPPEPPPAPKEEPIRPELVVTVIPVLADGVLEEISDMVFETVRAAALRGLQSATNELPDSPT